jgi:hypothetical protein
LAGLEPSHATYFAIRIAPFARELAQELLDAVATKFLGEDHNKNVWRMERSEARFAFCEGSIEPARARYRLERAWARSSKENLQERNSSAMVNAMAKFNGQPALD